MVDKLNGLQLTGWRVGGLQMLFFFSTSVFYLHIARYSSA